MSSGDGHCWEVLPAAVEDPQALPVDAGNYSALSFLALFNICSWSYIAKLKKKKKKILGVLQIFYQLICDIKKVLPSMSNCLMPSWEVFHALLNKVKKPVHKGPDEGQE